MMSTSELDQVDWNLCISCQEDSAENIRCPTNNKNKDGIVTTYNDAAFLLREFFSIGQLPETFHTASINNFISLFGSPRCVSTK